ncbi:acetoacetate decarboxylase [Nocardia brasiliensis]|uniref:Acetoacetate decarboxylase n=1 Tax=Nocardia brasiliensis TaxID=37326 RepID=A0A6G9XJU3_NOCBR|nr:acetoacetate decarboxylase family protein [Nocardia brasiliensis]QIS01177.1 acetoacetate decarboxylase [Nocardia brasiliensis]
MTEFVEVKLGTHAVEVPKGGYFDRYRMRADLDEVARDPQVRSVDYFRSLRKRVMDSPLGETANPTYYYSASILQLTMLAPLDALHDRLPEPLEPLALMPGIGMVAIAVYNYRVSDIDPYREAAVTIPVRPPRHGGSPEIDAAAALANGTAYSYVLSLPVTSEIARVRGVYNYGLPKWLTDVDLDIDRRVTARIGNDDGGTDLAIDLPLPPIEDYPSGTNMTTWTSLTQLDGVWGENRNQTNILSAGSVALPREIELTLGSGRMSDDLRSVHAQQIISASVIREGQLTLYMPLPTSLPTLSKSH